jgi:hypothetical protein
MEVQESSVNSQPDQEAVAQENTLLVVVLRHFEE